MRSYILTLVGALLLGNSAVALAQDYDDVYYDTKSSKQKANTEKEHKGTKVIGYNPYFKQRANGAGVTVADTLSQTVNGRDVDEYNRRYSDDAQQYYAEEAASYGVADSVSNDDFKYTDRIVKFHNADVVVHSNDSDLIELYYDNRPQVNLIVGSTYTGGWYDDPFTWGYYDSWYSWGWGRPYRYGWYAGWYSPWNAWGWYSPWHYGWYDPWCWGGPHYAWGGHWGHGAWGHGAGWGPAFRPSDRGRIVAGHRAGNNGMIGGRPGYASAGRQTAPGAASMGGRRAGYAGSRPGTTGDIRQRVGSDRVSQRRGSFGSSDRVSQSRSSFQNRESGMSRSNTYNNNGFNQRSSGFSGSSSRGGFSGGGGFGGGSHGGGGGGRGGRR